MLMASLWNEFPIANAEVLATIQKPDGSIQSFQLKDDGIAPDAWADDGRYSAILDYNQNGVYNITVHFNNIFGEAFQSTAGLLFSNDPADELMPNRDSIPINENFQRFTRLQVTVSGLVSDDHGNVPAEATWIDTDNSDNPGRIDYAGDLDVFAFQASQVGDYFLRVTHFALGMDPRLRLISGDGSLVLFDIDLTTHAADNGYLYLPIKANAGEVFYAEVSHTDPNALSFYQVSVGSQISSDRGVQVDWTQAPIITSANQVTFENRRPSHFLITTTGKPTPEITYTGDLPLGITFTDHGDGTASLSGTPVHLHRWVDMPEYPITIIADNGVSPAARQPFTLILVVNYGPGATFQDVLPSHYAHLWIERLYRAGITTGCSIDPHLYCPEDEVTRAEMAVFLERGLQGADFVPPAVSVASFTDVPLTHWAVSWIEQLYDDEITTGCGVDPLRYCPEGLVSRAEMAIFLLRVKHGADYTPPAVGLETGFTDVPITHWAAAWIKQLAAEGITSGYQDGNFGPEDPVTRAQMAIFLVRTFNLP
jgi:hypothetical protein